MIKCCFVTPLGPAFTQPAYLASVNNVKSQYDTIGPTHYREHSQLQIEATLTKEAFARAGDIEVIKELGKPVTSAPKKEDSCKRIAP